MKKIVFLFVICFNLSLASSATNLDSLLAIWQDETQVDSSRVKAYKDFIWKGFLFSNPDTAFVLAEDLVSFGQEKPYPKAQTHGNNIQGVSYYLKGNYPKALEYYKRSLKIREEIGDKKGIAGSLNNIGMIYESQSNYTKALKYFQRSLKISEEIGDENVIANSLNNIGMIFNSQSNYPKALAYYQRSLKIYEETGDKKGIASSLNNIGMIFNSQSNYPEALEYFQRSLKISEEIGDKSVKANSLNNIGSIYQYQSNYPKALAYYKRSLKIYEETGDKHGIAGALSNIGLIYQSQSDYPKALEYSQRSLKIREEIGDKQGIALALYNIGLINQFQSKNQEALKQCQKSLKISEEIESLERQKGACSCLYEIYKSMGKGNEALVYIEKMNVISDSLNAKETVKKLQQIEFNEQVLADSIANAKKANKLSVKNANTRNVLIGAAILLLLIAGVLFGRYRFTKKAKAVVESEKDKSDNLLLNILPADIAKELKETGKAEARDFENVSILFTDFKHFTQTSEKLSAKELVAEINTCFETFDTICKTYEVEKIKTIGDAYMAASGLPVYTNDSTKNAIHAALEMQAFITKRKQEKDAQGEPAFEMRVGIHTGNVVAGIVGKSKFQYDIWGDTVNTAARTESSGEVGKVNISQATYELIKDLPDFTFEHRGKIAAKGKGELDMYFVSKT